MKSVRASADCVNEMAKRSACAAAKIKTAPEHVSVICGSEKWKSGRVCFQHLLQRKKEQRQNMFSSFAAAKKGTAPEYVSGICHNEKWNSTRVCFRHLPQRKKGRHQSMFSSFATMKICIAIRNGYERKSLTSYISL